MTTTSSRSPRAPRPTPRSARSAALLALAGLVTAGLTACVAERSTTAPARPATSAASPGESPAPAASPASVRPSPASPRRTVAPTDAAREIRALLSRVRTVPRRPDVPGYDRECGPGAGCVFGTEWSDDTSAPQGRDGCDTRNDVLARDLRRVRFSASSPDCDVVGGILRDPYTGTRLDLAVDSSAIHIDHLVPLAAAWDLGAARWSPARRARFANDVDLELLAVSGSANLSKGDGGPADWLPPRTAFRCEYVLRYLRVAVFYRLAVTRADAQAIRGVRRTDC